MFSFIAAVIVGALSGWIASKIMNTDAQQGAMANIVIGMVGALIAQTVFGQWLGVGGAQAAGQGFSFMSILWGVAGASVLIAILKAAKILK